MSIDRIPIIKFQTEDGNIISYKLFLVKLSNNVDLTGGLVTEYVENGQSWSDLLMKYAPVSGEYYLKIVSSGYYLKLSNRRKRHKDYDDPKGDILLCDITLCDNTKNVLFGLGNLEGRLNGNTITGQNYFISSTLAYDMENDKFIIMSANVQYKTNDTWLTSPVYSTIYVNGWYAPHYFKFNNTEQTVALIGTQSWSLISANTTNHNIVKKAFITGNNEYYYTKYPFKPSETGGGNGDADTTSDNINIPNTPQNIPLQTNVIKMYNPSTQELTNLTSFLWSDSFIDDIKQIFGNPMDSIISLKCFDVNIPTTGRGVIKLGRVSSEVSSNIVANQYITLDCGTIHLKEFFGSALDYNPYTTVELYLPYCNTITLNTDDVMGALINVTYIIDALTGACVAHVKVSKNIDGTPLNSVLYSVGGNCAYDIPISSNHAIGLNTALIGAVANSAIGAITGGASGAITSALSVSATKQRIQKNANLSSNIGTLGIKKPYVVISRPIQSIANEYGKFVGYPLNVRAVLKNLSGFTQIDSCIIDFNATEEEKGMIEELLKDGVIL